MSNLAEELTASVDAVACLGSTSAEIDALSDPDALAGQEQIADARRLLDTFAAWMAATLARRSRPELGNAGLAAKQGFLNPVAMIQTMTGSTRGDAAKLVAVGTMMAETDAAEALVAAAGNALDGDGPDGDGLDGDGLDGGRPDGDSPGADVPVVVPWQAPIAYAITTGELSVDAAESIRKGLGDVDTAVTALKLTEALTRLLAEAPTLNADQLFRRARRLRDELDEAGIAAREKQAQDDRYWRVWRQRDGMVRVNALLDPESGESVLSAYDHATSPRRGGPRFVDKEAAAWAERIIHDERTIEQIAADAFVQMLRIAGEADPGRVFGGRRPAVRVIVTETVLDDRAGHGHLEGNPNPVSWETIQRNLCDTGTVGIKFDDDGRCAGRSAARKTNIADGVLLCRRHHMILHNNHWHILRDRGRYWLRPPATIDPTQKLMPMPSKSPPMLNLYRAESNGNRRAG